MPEPSTIEQLAESHRLAGSDLAVTFADPARRDLPLVYVNDAFCALTGYARERCIGRNCRFLQGRRTDPEALSRVRAGIDAESFRLTRLVNYRRDGEAFDNALLLGPVRDVGGAPTLFFGMQWNLGDTLDWRASPAAAGWGENRLEAQLERYEAIVARLYERSVERGGEAVGPAFVERLMAVSRPHQYPPLQWVPNWTRADHLMRYLVEPYGPGLGHRVDHEGGADILAADVFTPVALAVHELSRRFLALAEDEAEPPSVTVVSEARGRDGEPFYELLWRESRAFCRDARDGEGARAAARRRSSEHGLALVREVAAHAGGRFETHADAGGLEAWLSVPNRPHLSLSDDPTSGA